VLVMQGQHVIVNHRDGNHVLYDDAPACEYGGQATNALRRRSFVSFASSKIEDIGHNLGISVKGV